MGRVSKRPEAVTRGEQWAARQYPNASKAGIDAAARAYAAGWRAAKRDRAAPHEDAQLLDVLEIVTPTYRTSPLGHSSGWCVDDRTHPLAYEYAPTLRDFARAMITQRKAAKREEPSQ